MPLPLIPPGRCRGRETEAEKGGGVPGKEGQEYVNLVSTHFNYVYSIPTSSPEPQVVAKSNIIMEVKPVSVSEMVAMETL